jgi:hypothetical protein
VKEKEHFFTYIHTRDNPLGTLPGGQHDNAPRLELET